MTEPMTKFFNVKDARVAFERRDDLVMKLYHPEHGVFRVADVDAHARAIVYFYKGTKIHEVFADECIYNYPAEDSKGKTPASNPFTQDKIDICYKIISVTADMLKAAGEHKKQDDIEFFAAWAAYEASQLSMYINHCLNEGEKK
jgi:4-hydroxyphenylpyruvate dioxygenase-like putative hemolysin